MRQPRPSWGTTYCTSFHISFHLDGPLMFAFFKSGRCRQAFPWVETGLWVMGCDRRGHWTYLRWGVIVSSQSPSSQWWHQLGHELGFLMVHNWTAAIIQCTQLNGSVEKTYPEKCTLGQTRPTISDQNKERRSHLVQPQWPLLRI